MARGMKGKKGGKTPAPKSAPKLNGKDASINRINTYEDTLEEGGVDDFMHNRDKISLAADQASDDEEDFIGNQGEEVFGLNLPDEDDEADHHEDDYDEEEEEQAPVKKARKSKAVEDKTKKGRYGKESDDDDDLGLTDEESETDEDEDRGEESWGRQYYAKPSNRYARDADDDDYDSDKELSKTLYAQESEALQKSIRRSMKGEEDFGLDEVDEEAPTQTNAVKFSLDQQPAKKVSAPAPPPDADPSKLINHLAIHEPLKLALARDFPLVVRKLQKTERGIKRMQKDAAQAQKHGDLPQLNQGLGWLHYQSLLTYATMLAFYLHLAALPEDQRPNFDTHPILPRLAQLKEGVAMLEDLDFDAASVDDDDDDENEEGDDGLDDEEDDELADGKAELLGRLVGKTGMDWDDADEVWEGGDLEDGELDDLREDAEGELSEEDSDLDLQDDEEEEIVLPKKKSAKKEKKDKSLNKKSKFVLEEPEFVPATKNKQSTSRSRRDEDDEFGDPTALNAADSADKSAKKRSLRFHTSKIAATSARRAAAREARLGGDDDIPYRSKQAARDAVLQRNSASGNGGEDLDGSEWSEKDKKRAREVMEAEDAVEADDGYYELVKKRKTETKQAKKQEYDVNAAQAIAQQRQEEAEEASSGPRSLTRAIEKNRGLTPHRKKSTRNPRVKKREQYEKAKIKLGSQRAIYKGGQSALSGAYAGEKSGISLASKSRRF